MIVSTKKPGESLVLAFDFTAALASGDSIASAESMAVETRLGAAGLTAAAPTVASGIVSSRVSGGDEGSVYAITATVTTTGGDTLAITATMAVG